MRMRSRMIRVLKRDDSTEHFDPAKLRRCLWLAMGGRPGRLVYADALSQAIADYLRLSGTRAVSSRALFEMAQGALRFTGQHGPAARMEDHARRRREARRAVVILQEDGKKCCWDRSWAIEQLRRRWRISRPAARALSGHLERQLLSKPVILTRQNVQDTLDELVDQFGLSPWCLLASVPQQQYPGTGTM